MPRKIRERIEATLLNVDTAVDSVELKTLDILEAVEETLQEGISFSIEISGQQFPVKIILEPNDDTADT